MTSDPVRLLEDPSAGALLRGDLVHAAQAEVQGLDLAAGLVALQKATATVTSSTTVVAGTSLLTKLGIGAGVAVSAVVLWLGLGGGSDPGEGERVTAPAVAAAPEPETKEPEGGAEARAMHGAEGTVAPVRAETTAAAHEAATIESDVAQPAKLEAGDAATKLEAGAPGETDEPTAKPATSRRKGATGDRPSGSSEKAAGDRPSGTAPAPADDVLREAKLVAKARSNLARDPARALALAEEAESDFPQGQLVEERRAIAIRALVALGRQDEAQRRAEPFLAQYGRGAHAAAVRRALDGTETP